MELQVKNTSISLMDYHQSITNKIQSMSLVHKKLYESENLSEINIRNYLQDLVDIFRQTSTDLNNKINYELQIDDVIFNIDIAIPFGLVLSELITNSLKHAFQGKQNGKISISLKNHLEKGIYVVYADDGIGVPPDLDLNSDKILGLNIVRSIIEYQLDGEISFNSDNGFYCTFHFDDSKFEKRI